MEDELQKEIRECRLLMEDPPHLRHVDANRYTDSNGCRRGRPKHACSSHGFLAKEISGGEKGNSGLFAALGNYSEFGSTTLEVEYGVGCTTLREKGLARFNAVDASPNPRSREKHVDIKLVVDFFFHARGLPRMR